MNFDPAFSQTAIPLRPDREGFQIPTVDVGLISVGQLVDGSSAQKAMDAKHPDKGGALMTDIPSMVLVHRGSQPIYLTWNEAYNLGWALIKVALVSLFG